MNNKYDVVMERIQFRYFVDKPPIVTEDMIREFEIVINHQLPEDYRHFLVKYGFGGGRRAYFSMGDNSRTKVEVFYGLGLDDSYDLRRVRRIFLNRPDTVGPARLLPESILAIASSPGAQICLVLSGKNRGRVFWWPSEGFADDPDYNADDPEANMTHLAPDFDTFINSLRQAERRVGGA